VTDAVLTEQKPLGVRPRVRAHGPGLAVGIAVWVFLVGNAAGLVWMWWHGGNVTRVHTTGEALTSAARITGLISAYLALIQVVLLSRLPFLERLAGFDRLTVWHRWNGHACLDLVLAHVVLSIWGYSLMDHLTIAKETSTMIWGGVYPGMITATVGTFLFVAVTVSSIVVARRRLRYEWWYAVHLTAYAAIALAWFHQIPTGNELVLDRVAADYWTSLYIATLAVLAVFRIGVPLVNAWRYRLRVAEVVEEGPGVVSLLITGRKVERLNVQPGQFFLWRFLARDSWWASHPFSLSAPNDGSLRITVKALGDFSGRIRRMRPGTRVLVEGPFGSFTERARRREKVVLIAGGIGITPIRALLEEMEGDVIVLYRVMRDEDIIFRDELESIAHERHIDLRFVVGDHETDEGRDLLSPAHLRVLVPDIAEREVYVCGPPAMTNAIRDNVRHAHVPARFIHAERFAL
jgi:predicted ferric reductase